LLGQREVEGDQLVAGGIAEIGGVEFLETLARRAFVAAAVGERIVVDPVDLFVAVVPLPTVGRKA
jgi:hypothetical protein